MTFACFMCPFGEIAAGGVGLFAGGLMALAILRHKAKAAILKTIRSRKRTIKLAPCDCDCCNHDHSK